MKKISISIIYIIMVLSILLAQNNFTKINFIDKGRYLILRLPYEVDVNCATVFEEDTPLAINVIEIIADGKTLSFIDDMNSIDGRTYWNLNTTTPGQKQYYISMYWYKDLPEILRWNDGKGLIFTEIEPGIFQPSTNSYELVKGMQYLEIRYRILLPDSSMPLKGTGPLDRKKNRYSEIYTICVDLRDIWE